MSNPHAKNCSSVGLYYDKNGELSYIIHADNDDQSPFQRQDLVHISVPYSLYQSRKPINVGGRAVFHDLNKAVVSILSNKNPDIASKLRNINISIDNKIAAKIEQDNIEKQEIIKQFEDDMGVDYSEDKAEDFKNWADQKRLESKP